MVRSAEVGEAIGVMQPSCALLLVRPPALLDDGTELLELALGAEERAKALLRQLARLLVL